MGPSSGSSKIGSEWKEKKGKPARPRKELYGHGRREKKIASSGRATVTTDRISRCPVSIGYEGVSPQREKKKREKRENTTGESQ